MKDIGLARLTVKDLGVGRGGLPLLRGVSFALAPGQALMLRGANGIGKTTLLRTIAGLQPPQAGRIEAEEDTLAFAGHSDGVKATMTVEENLEFWAAVFGHEGTARAMRDLDLMRLMTRPARDLSAGQRRRLGLARLLVTGRAIWLLDEPTVSLDRESAGLFEAALAAHLGQGGAALISSHLDIGGMTDVLDLTPFRATPAALGLAEGSW